MSFQEFLIQSPGASIQDYFACGGFPFRVSEFLKNPNFAPDFGLDIFDDIFYFEIGRRKLNRSIALEVLFRLSQLGCSSASYTSLSQKISLKSDVFRRYTDALGDAFLWTDPALAYLAYHLGHGEVPKTDFLAECTVGTHLLRQFEKRIFEGVSAPRSVFTWKSSSGNEIDFLIVDRSKKLIQPIEVKYQSSISDWDFQVMERAFGKGILVTQSDARKRQGRDRYSESVPLESFLKTSTELQTIRRP